MTCSARMLPVEALRSRGVVVHWQTGTLRYGIELAEEEMYIDNEDDIEHELPAYD